MVASGMRNSLLLAIAPTATIASIAGCYECIEPQLSNLFKRETLSGEFLQVNRYLADDLKRLGLWTEEIRDAIKRSEGSIQDVAAIPEEVRRTYRTAWELSMRSLIDLAAARGAYIDQSQSLNLFSESPTINSLSAMYFHAWKSGLKTTYYLRSRPRTRINQTTVSAAVPGTAATVAKAAPAVPTKTLEQLACSLENPESCEVCT
jgi:ribonucleoside-diphosphate reductase alpha chain